MAKQIHIKPNLKLHGWLKEKAKKENRSINNYVITTLIRLMEADKEKENAQPGTKDSQSTAQPK